MSSVLVALFGLLVGCAADKSLDSEPPDDVGPGDSGACVETLWYLDADGDGYGDPADAFAACESPEGRIADATDCDDTRTEAHPGAAERCDGTDEDCDGERDEDFDRTSWYRDSDGDGYGDASAVALACAEPPGYVSDDRDCDDADANEPVHVDASLGTDAGDGTAASPLRSIQAGIDQANACVFVSAGTYAENIDFDGKALRVEGVDGSEATTIQGAGSDSVVTIEEVDGTAELVGFTVAGGSGTEEVETVTWLRSGPEPGSEITTRYYGGGIFVLDSQARFEDLLVRDNLLPEYFYSSPEPDRWEYVYSYGGGLFVSGSDVVATSVVFTVNSADDGGAIYVAGDSTLAGLWLTVANNHASGGGGLTAAGAVTLRNSIFNSNTATDLGASSGGSDVNVLGGTTSLEQITSVGARGRSGHWISSGATLTVWNSIIVMEPTASGFVFGADFGADFHQSYTNIYSTGIPYDSSLTDPTGTDGNLSVDPLFLVATDDLDASNDDLHLAAGSPCADVGDASEGTDTDGSGVDLGAFGGPEGSGW